MTAAAAPTPRTQRVTRAMVFVTALATAAWGCMPPEGGGAGEGPGHRSQTLRLTPQQELSLGRQAYQEILGKSRVVRGGPDVERARDVARKIIRAATIPELQMEINYRLQGYQWEWDVNVLEDKQVNAFCLPGGRIGVYTGLIQLVNEGPEPDAWLATVLGHEIAHALAHHSNERISRQLMREQAIRAAGGVLGQLDPRHAAMLIQLLGGVSQVQGLKYDRQQESEADHIGVFLMTFAGYDPDAAVRFWEKMTQASRGRHPPEILSDHPSDEHRITKLKEWVPMARKGKQMYDAGYVKRPQGR
jgi:predicted Zn-dependent protease